MYTNFFGLSDIPFSIAPNPEYLFMSDRHREALAHLTHGLGDTGGFVLLTGEVGTGKTTISRCLLEQLPENTQVAFILNPTLSCLELLATICDELKVRYKKTGATLKYLTDKIQDKLLKNQSNDINTILIIDEAQHLQPEVLEQLRLLTNLETNTKKLLQVILIGQPELQQLLQRRDLRQLAQRITARYHLLPLTKSEVEQYITHRVGVADCHRTLFNKQAVTIIHKISQGIPRIINLLCDRALSLAYGENQSVVNRKLVIQAAEQALGQEFHYQPWWRAKNAQYALVGLFVFCIAGASYWLGQERTVLPSQMTQIESPGSENTEDNTSDDNVSVQTDNPTNELVSTNPEVTNETMPSEISSQPALSEVTTPEDVTSQITPANTEQEVARAAVEAVDPVRVEQQQVISSKPKPPVKFDLSKVEGASGALLERLQSAVDASNEEIEDEIQEEADASEPAFDPALVKRLTDMPVSFQNAIPNMQFDMHIYASDGEGFVKVNGRDRYEGDNVGDGIELVKILPQKVILKYQGEQFSLPALATW